MSGQKTEQPTEKRIRDSRKKGQVFKSNDLTQAFLFITASAVLAFAGGSFVGELQEIMRSFFRVEILGGAVSHTEMLAWMGAAWTKVLVMLAPMLVALAFVAGFLTFLQVRALFSMEVIQPKIEKLNPLKGLKNIFGQARTYIELVKNLVKFAVIFALVYITLSGSIRDIVLAGRIDLAESAGMATKMMFDLLFRIGVVFLVLGGADFFLQKKLYMKNLMMSKEEVKREYKESEGDPHIKQARKQSHEELLSNNMMQSVPKADVVVVNPTHMAVAVRYEETAMVAPTVTAKGQRLMAEKIRALAEEHKVPIIRNVTLAHGLFEVEVGHEIPEDLYEAVAEVLNWVYQLSEVANA